MYYIIGLVLFRQKDFYDTISKRFTTVNLIHTYIGQPICSVQNAYFNTLYNTMLDVTAAIIQREGLILAARRKPGCHLAGFWEFPGGKIEQGETAAECLYRELKEELGIDSKVESFFGESCYDYGSKQVRLLCFFVNYVSGSIILNDHDEIKWLAIDQLFELNWAPADIPIVKKLVKLKR